MKKLIASLLLTLSLAAATTFAQVTYSSFSSILGDDSQFDNLTYGQTFTGIDGLSSVIWHLNGVSGSVDLNTYIVEWDTNTNLAVSSVSAFGTTQNASSVGFFDVTFSQNLSLNPSKTYALLLSATTVSPALIFTRYAADQLSDPFFGSGYSFRYDTMSVAGGFSNFQTDLASISPDAIYPINDIGMTITTLASIPEPKSAAAGLAGLFTACLFLRRSVWQKRRAALAA
jgi:hypothetical protein